MGISKTKDIYGDVRDIYGDVRDMMCETPKWPGIGVFILLILNSLHGMEGLKEAIRRSLLKRKLGFSLKKEQMECISSIVAGRDVLAVLPTGFGKSLIYQILPDVYNNILDAKNSIVLVISPLNVRSNYKIE